MGGALCHSGSVTYDPGRRGGGRVPVLRNEWREPLRAQRDPVADDSGRTRSNRDDRQQWRKQTWLGRFVSTYGWRAYALPVLIALTAVVVYQTVTGTGASRPADAAGPIQGPPTIDPASTAIIGAPPKGHDAVRRQSADRHPARRRAVHRGGRQDVAHRARHHSEGGRGHRPSRSPTPSRWRTASTPPRSAGTRRSPRMVSETLANPKSWTHNPQFAFTRIDSGEPDFRVSLTSPMTVREGCGYDIPLEASCYNPAYQDGQPRVFINEARWVRGAVPFQGDIGSYRQYVVNHEVGHAIGYRASRAVRRQRRAGAGDDAADVLDQQRRRRQVRPGIGPGRRQVVPVQPVAVSHRLTARCRAGRHPTGRLRQAIAVEWTMPGVIDTGLDFEIEERTGVDTATAAGGASRGTDARRGRALQPPPDHPRPRGGRAEAAQERSGAGDRRRRAGLARPAVPGRRGRRHHRHRRIRRGRRVQPAAADHPRPVRHRAVEGGERPRLDPGDQPAGRGATARVPARARQRGRPVRRSTT